MVDSSASCHLTSNANFFSSYINGNFGYVRIGNEGSSKIVGIGIVCLETSTGCKLVLENVRHVPDVIMNIISIGKLDDDGYVNRFGEGKWKLTKGSLIVARGKKQKDVYMMQAKLCMEKDKNVPGSSIGASHKRLDHMKGMKILHDGKTPLSIDWGDVQRKGCCNDVVVDVGDVKNPPYIDHVAEKPPREPLLRRKSYRKVRKVHRQGW